jgi:broad specificity phosphatase PhoE
LKNEKVSNSGQTFPSQNCGRYAAREWNLSDEGRARSQRLAERLTKYRPEFLVSSVEPKARQTAEIISIKHGLELHIVEGLREHDRDGLSYIPNDEFQSAICEFFERQDELVFGNETANQAHARFNRAVQSVLNYLENKTTVIVAHGTVIALFVSRLICISDILFWNDLGLPSFVVIDMQDVALIKQENII